MRTVAPEDATGTLANVKRAAFLCLTALLLNFLFGNICFQRVVFAEPLPPDATADARAAWIPWSSETDTMCADEPHVKVHHRVASERRTCPSGHCIDEHQDLPTLPERPPQPSVASAPAFSPLRELPEPNTLSVRRTAPLLALNVTATVVLRE